MDFEIDSFTDMLCAWPEPVGYVARTDRSSIGNVNIGANWLSRISPQIYLYGFLDGCFQVVEQDYLLNVINQSLFTAAQKASTYIYPVYGNIRKMGYLALSPDGTEAGVPSELRAEMAYRAECERQYRNRQADADYRSPVYVNLLESEANVLKAGLQWTAILNGTSADGRSP